MGKVYDVNGNVICEGEGVDPTPTHTDAECTTAFLEYMAKKASVYGMTGTHYVSPSGLANGSYSTPQDALKLGISVTCNKYALDIWGTQNRSFSILGNHARTISVSNNVIGGSATDLGAYYDFLGGKGGSLSNNVRAQILLVDIEGHPTVLSLMGNGTTAFTNIYKSAKELCDMVKASLNGQTPTAGENLNTLVADDGGYCACLVPVASGGYQNLETPAELIARPHSISASPTVSRTPASTSKVMTMLCALDYVTDFHALIRVKTSDLSSGSGSTFYDGDRMTIYDALRIMMMESSNTLANTIARVIGGKILEIGD